MMIYCVEDDKDILQIMMYTLKSSGFEVKGFEESCSFWQAIEQEKPRLVMLDIMLPGEDGMSILNTLRNTFWHVGDGGTDTSCSAPFRQDFRP